MSIEQSAGALVITGKHIGLYRLLSLKAGLSLECKGLKMSRGRSCYAIVKSEFGFRGNKERVLAQLCKHIEEWDG